MELSRKFNEYEYVYLLFSPLLAWSCFLATSPYKSGNHFNHVYASSIYIYIYIQYMSVTCKKGYARQINIQEYVIMTLWPYSHNKDFFIHLF